jgi:probable rRNA maturation factor
MKARNMSESFTIEIQNEAHYPVAPERLQQAALTVLGEYDLAPNSSLTIVLTDDAAVQALNRQHRGVDTPTDILSFPAAALPDDITDEAPYLGDLIIAFPYAKAQAERENHALLDSLALLVVHGTLHLLGYDHDTPENRAAMWAEQAAALRQLGIDEALVPALESSPHDA